MKKMTYEQAMNRLEEIVRQLENGSLPLEDSLKLFEEGSALTSFCAERLALAEQKVTELTATVSGGTTDEV